MRISTSIDISLKPKDVFPWVADPQKAMLWQKDVKEGEILKQAKAELEELKRLCEEQKQPYKELG